MKPIVPTVIAVILVTALSLSVYHRFVVRPAQSIATVDLEAVLSERQATLSEELIKAGNDQERAALQRRAQVFAERVRAATGALAAECDCLVYDRTVLVAVRPGTPDLTEQLKRRLNE